MAQLDDRKTIIAWSLYDWANSAFATTVMAGFFPIFFKMYWNTEVNTVLGDEEIEAVRIINNKTQELTDIPVDGLFIAIGHKPNTDIFKGWLDMDSEGYLITQADTTKTNIPGVFVGGDAQDKIYRQAVTAAGTGCMAALDAQRFLEQADA